MPSLTLENLWIAIGFGGQALFASRFLVQWIATERRRQSVVPTVFWYLSLGGGLVLLSYALWRRDPVFIAGPKLRSTRLLAQPLVRAPWQARGRRLRRPRPRSAGLSPADVRSCT